MGKTISNAELWSIADRHRKDEDVGRLVDYILHLKRQLAEAQGKVRRQRKNLNAIRVERADAKEA